MKFSAQEEYGLRCLLRIAREENAGGLTISEISKIEGLSQANVAKLLRILRIGGFIDSARGQSGGYTLKLQPEEIVIADVLSLLGGRLFDGEFCNHHSGIEAFCSNQIDCSIRSLWVVMQNVIDNIIERTTLADLLKGEEETHSYLAQLADETNSFFKQHRHSRESKLQKPKEKVSKEQ